MPSPSQYLYRGSSKTSQHEVPVLADRREEKREHVVCCVDHAIEHAGIAHRQAAEGGARQEVIAAVVEDLQRQILYESAELSAGEVPYVLARGGEPQTP